VQATRVSWSHCVRFDGNTSCPNCGMLIKLTVPNPPPPLVQCPGCKTVCLNTAAAVVNQRVGDDFRHPLCKWLNPMVLLTWTLITFVISFGICVTIPAVVDVFSLWGAFHLSIALFLSINTVYNYYNTIDIEPGYPTDVPFENCDPIAPFCPKCNYAKPVRAHHCSQTGCCVLRMDHYCGFAQNSIGFRNHRHFLLFCFFIWLSNLYAVAMSIPIGLNLYYNPDTLRNMQGWASKHDLRKQSRSLAHLHNVLFGIIPMEAMGHLLMIVIYVVCFVMISFLVSQQWRMLTKGLT